jgi:hypothetical protein
MEIKNSADLRAAIIELENKKQEQKRQLAISYHAVTESLKPMNLIKSTFSSAKESPGLTGSLLNAGIGLGVGFLSKKLLIGKSAGLVKKILGPAIQMGVASVVANNSGNFKTVGKRLLQTLFRSKKREQAA